MSENQVFGYIFLLIGILMILSYTIGYYKAKSPYHFRLFYIDTLRIGILITLSTSVGLILSIFI